MAREPARRTPFAPIARGDVRKSCPRTCGHQAANDNRIERPPSPIAEGDDQIKSAFDLTGAGRLLSWYA